MENETKDSEKVVAQRISEHIAWMYRTDERIDEILKSLPTRTDAEISEIRSAAVSLGRASWKIQIACDAQVLNRVRLRGGRGNKDLEGVGVHAAVVMAATDLNVTPRTIYQNAQIYNAFFADIDRGTESELMGCLDILEEKEYFKIALRTPDPLETIELLARKKTEDPNFSTKDAWRLVKPLKVPDITEKLPANTLDDDGQHLWESIIENVRDFANKYPTTKTFLYYAIEEVRYIIQLPTQSIQDRILTIIQKFKTSEVDDIAEFMHEDRDVVVAWLNSMVENKKLRVKTLTDALGQNKKIYYEVVETIIMEN